MTWLDLAWHRSKLLRYLFDGVQIVVSEVEMTLAAGPSFPNPLPSPQPLAVGFGGSVGGGCAACDRGCVQMGPARCAQLAGCS